MLELHSPTAFPETLRNGVLCIGNFDGVHRGHAQMLAAGRAAAAKSQIPFTIMTFHPHPAHILKPDTPRHPLTTLAQRKSLLAQFNPDVLLIIPPTREFLSITAQDFLQNTVRINPQTNTGIGASLLVEGPTFTFGRGAKGTIRTLEQLGPTLGFQTQIIPAFETPLSNLTLVKVSSSLIRWLIEHGRVADAARCLGRPYSVTGTVIEGQKRGRTLGIPTANLQTKTDTDPGQLLPAPGIYAGRAKFANQSHLAAISVGDNPTFPGTPFSVEAHLLDFSADLYGQTITVEFNHWLRDMLPYAGPAPLVTQIQRDIAQTRQFATALSIVHNS